MHKNVSPTGLTANAAEAEGQFDTTVWNYGTDLDLLKVRLAKFTEKERGYARKLVGKCLSLNPNSELELNDDALLRSHNPLDIHLILNAVLSHLPVKSLLTCRLINRTWNAKALPWIQKKIKKSVSVSPDNFPIFCADFDSSDVLPFDSLEIILQGMDKDDCHTFFTKHGSKLRKLKVEEYNSDEGFDASALQESLRMLQSIFRHVSNLKTLDLQLEYLPRLFPGLFDFAEEDESVTLAQVEYLNFFWTSSLNQDFLCGLVTLLPNLKVIDFEFPFSLRNERELEIFGNSLRQSLSLHTIHFPDFMFDVVHVLFRAMTTQGSLKLKELEMSMLINLDDTDKELELVTAQEDFLKSQSDNLEVLMLSMSSCYIDPNVIVPAYQKRQFPVLRNLKTATFVNNCNDRIEHWFPYLPLEPEHLPKLKSLCIVPKTMESDMFADSIFLSVQDVTLRDWRHVNTHLLPRIGRRFPNLRKLSKLEISVDLNAMDTIVTNFRDIEDLELKFFDRWGKDIQNFNLVIGGIPKEKWALAQDQLAASNEPKLNWIDPPGPSLRDLKSLKRLVIECEPFPQKRPRCIRIDEIGVYSTFLRLSPQLNLTFRGSFLISDELAAKLRGHYQNIYFIPAEPRKPE